MDPSTGTLLALFILLAPSTLLHAVAPKVPDLKIKTRRVGDSGSWLRRSPALRTARGGYDLTKPDTSANRVEVSVANPTVEALVYSDKFDRLYVATEKMP